MMALAQFRNKIKTHGLLRTFLYCAEFAVRPLWRRFWVEGAMKSYSQSYEDVIIDRLLGNKKDGSYLDIGAYDPHGLSNTKRFYERGWRGCNIEPEPTRHERFLKERPEDINLNMGVSDCEGRLVFYDIVPGPLSTFSEERAKELEQMGAKINKQIEVPVITMKEVFTKWLKGKPVDFCTIDTEGMDLRVLRSNDWTKFRPRVLCVEVSAAEGSTANSVKEETIASFLRSMGYKKVQQTYEYGNPLNEIYVSET
jgi:FkbM family methyltransferase